MGGPPPAPPAGDTSVSRAPAPSAPRSPVSESPARTPPAETLARASTRAEREPVARRATPSFDCGKAWSRVEKLICADDELSRLDRDLGRLHAHAKAVAPDASAFRRQNDVEWKRRERNCADKACVVQWYEQRRQQLEAIVAGAPPPAQ